MDVFCSIRSVLCNYDNIVLLLRISKKCTKQLFVTCRIHIIWILHCRNYCKSLWTLSSYHGSSNDASINNKFNNLCVHNKNRLHIFRSNFVYFGMWTNNVWHVCLDYQLWYLVNNLVRFRSHSLFLLSYLWHTVNCRRMSQTLSNILWRLCNCSFDHLYRCYHIISQDSCTFGKELKWLLILKIQNIKLIMFYEFTKLEI